VFRRRFIVAVRHDKIEQRPQRATIVLASIVFVTIESCAFLVVLRRCSRVEFNLSLKGDIRRSSSPSIDFRHLSCFRQERISECFNQVKAKKNDDNECHQHQPMSAHANEQLRFIRCQFEHGNEHAESIANTSHVCLPVFTSNCSCVRRCPFSRCQHEHDEIVNGQMRVQTARDSFLQSNLTFSNRSIVSRNPICVQRTFPSVLLHVEEVDGSSRVHTSTIETIVERLPRCQFNERAQRERERENETLVDRWIRDEFDCCSFRYVARQERRREEQI
jgi:hypothetical protein